MREWRGGNSAAFEGAQRQAYDLVSSQLFELTKGVKLLSGNRQPTQGGTNPVVGVGGSAFLKDGDYGNIKVKNDGTLMYVTGIADAVVVREPMAGSGLQDLVNDLGAGATIILGDGTHYGNATSPTTPLTVSNYNVSILGQSAQTTYFGSPILSSNGKFHLSNVAIDPGTTSYGLKIYNGGSPFISRSTLDNIIIGDIGQHYEAGPTNGLQIDGAGILQASNCTFAFCSANGLLADSTGAEPNTTLQFDNCSFVGNGSYGIKLLQSLSIAEFRGGNSEQNGRSGSGGELYAESILNLYVHGFDFESTYATGITNAVEFQNGGPAIFQNCNFLTGDTGTPSYTPYATRAILLAGLNGARISECYFAGWRNTGIVRLSETCSGCIVTNNRVNIDNGSPWIEDYSR